MNHNDIYISYKGKTLALEKYIEMIQIKRYPNKNTLKSNEKLDFKIKYQGLSQLINDDCSDSAVRNEMKNIFKDIDTVDEFLYVWSLFYENKVCTPTYFDIFSGNISGDNQHVTYLTGQKFKNITLKGIIPVDSQVTNINDGQKGYIHAYVSNKIIKKLTTDLNRYDNIVAFNYNLLNTDEVCARDLYVTYQESEIPTNQTNLFAGSAYTNAGLIDKGTLHQILKWANNTLKKEINHENYSMLVIINPNFNSPSEYIIDVLLEVANNL